MVVGTRSRACAAGLLLLLFVGTPRHAVRADDEPTKAATAASLDALLDPIRVKHDVPGIAAAVVSSKSLLAIGAAGVRVRGRAAPVTADDLWHLGSCTKSMTATLIGRLVEAGTLRWSMTLPEAFPDLAKEMHADWKPVTLELILRNRGGMPADLSTDGLWQRLWQHRGTPRAARRLLTRELLRRAPASKPGTKFEYSNAGFSVVGHAAESITKVDYETLMQRELFAPLQMSGVGFGAPGTAAKFDQPWGHSYTKERRLPVPPGPAADNPPAIAPSNSVHLSMKAWSRYIQLHLAGARDGQGTLPIRRPTLRRIQTPRKGEDYALGWMVSTRPWAGGPVITHNGSNTMWFAVTWLAPRKDVAVLVACNQGGPPGEQAADAAVGACLRWHRAQNKGAAPAK